MQYQWTENGEREWTLEVVGYERSKATVVSIRVDCTLLRQGLKLPGPKKPYVVKQILHELGGGDDAGLMVSDVPHRLSEADVISAAKFVRGNASTRLPIVYVSVDRFKQPFVDVDQLANWLGGMAHVIVEPSRFFSFALARNTGYMNAYGGAVSIYWPQSAARQVRFVPAAFDSSDEMQRDIVNHVKLALTHIRPESKCTFSYLEEQVFRSRVEKFKAEGSATVGQYIEIFDAEIKAKDDRLKSLEKNLADVRAELQEQERLNRGFLKQGDEREFYPGELSDALIYGLERSLSTMREDGRRAHLIEDFLKFNKPSGIEKEISNEIKDAFAKSGDLGSDQRRTLEDLGFTVQLTGKHWKAVYQSDERYTFTISKTSGDHRAGKNLASIILQKLFK